MTCMIASSTTCRAVLTASTASTFPALCCLSVPAALLSVCQAMQTRLQWEKSDSGTRWASTQSRTLGTVCLRVHPNTDGTSTVKRSFIARSSGSTCMRRRDGWSATDGAQERAARAGTGTRVKTQCQRSMPKGI